MMLMIYGKKDDGIYLNGEYTDVNDGKLIYAFNKQIRRKNQKYLIYKNQQSVKVGQKEQSIDVMYIEYVKMNELLVFYKDIQNRLAFVIVNNMGQKELYRYLYTLDLKPGFKLKYIRLLHSIFFFGFITMRDENVESVLVQLGKENSNPIPVKYLFSDQWRKKYIGKKGKLAILMQFSWFRINKQSILHLHEKTSEINVPLFLQLIINQQEFIYPLKLNGKDKQNRQHYLYVSHDIKLAQNQYLFIRKSIYGQLTLVHTTKLSFFVKVLEHIAYLFAKIFGQKKYDIYFEKFSEGAKESAFLIFQYARLQGDSNAYYILDKNTSTYAQLKKEFGKHLVAKNSFRAFYYIYSSNKLISSDLSTHIQRRLYDNSRMMKKLIYTNTNKIFLQHGISLATDLFARGYYNKKIPIAPDYIVVSSQNEKDMFIKKSLYRENQLWHTGVPNLDTYVVDAKMHKKEEITFLLTWRPWDLHGKEQENSYIDRYVQFLSLIKTKAFYIDKKINLILHPKVKIILAENNPEKMKELESFIYEGDIFPVLSKSKVVVSDYSSIIFYAFAGGSNILFFWGDKELGEKYYKAQNFIQENNAFGPICYTMEDTVRMLQILYTQRQFDEYKKQFYESVDCTDGKNVERTYEKIRQLR